MHVTTFHQQHMQDYAIYMTPAYYQLYMLYFYNFFLGWEFQGNFGSKETIAMPIAIFMHKEGGP